MFPMFFGICPVCGVPHDEGGVITIKGEKNKQYVCLNCLDKMEDYEEDNNCSLSDHTLEELKEVLF